MSGAVKQLDARPTLLVGGLAADEAALLVDRLVAEGVAAALQPDATGHGSVWVRRGEAGHAAVLARLFAEVDDGVSVVAPPPSGPWPGSGVRRIVSALFLVVVTVAVLVAVSLALQI